MDKKALFDSLISDLSTCDKCLNLSSKSLYNIFKNPVVAKNIPSIWTDWYNRLDSKIMVIGQDWGPYKDMLNLSDAYLKDPSLPNWKSLIESEKSQTKQKLTKFLIKSSNGKIINIDNIYITNAILCGRIGDTYRGDNINVKKSTIMCSPHLKRQIDIVKPTIILTLGYYPLLSLSQIYNFPIAKNLKTTIFETPIIKASDIVIIPLYHPVAQITEEEQLKQYYRIWNYYN